MVVLRDPLVMIIFRPVLPMNFSHQLGSILLLHNGQKELKSSNLKVCWLSHRTTIQVLEENENHWFKNSIMLALLRKICLVYILACQSRTLAKLCWEDMTKLRSRVKWTKERMQEKTNHTQEPRNMVYIGWRLILHFIGRLIYIKQELGRSWSKVKILWCLILVLV